MGAPVFADFQIRFPAITILEPQFDSWALVAEFFVSDSAWPDADKCTYAKELMIAHLFTVESMGGGGSITSKKVGALSIGFGAPGSATDLQLTSYGKLYAELLAVCFPVTIGFC